MIRSFLGFLSVCFLALGQVGCMKMPDHASSKLTSVTYHFDGGEDLTALFVLKVSYTGPGGKTVTDYISALPWSKTVQTRLPFNAAMKVKFDVRNQIPEKALYNVGFTGYLTYGASEERVSETIGSLADVSAEASVPDVLHLRVGNLPISSSEANVSLRVAPLKFDKHFAFTFTTDDSYTSAYSRIWSLINGKWIDDKEFCHLGRPRTTGSVPVYPLTITDGCGNDRRFGYSCAIWPSFGDGNNETRIKDAANTADNSVYISWEELALMTDFGVSLLYHNVDERIWGKDDPQLIAKGIAVDNQKAYVKTGVRMKVLGLPDGNAAYADAAQLSEHVAFTRNSLKSDEQIDLRTCGSLYKKETYGGINSSNVAEKLDELAAQSAEQNPYWVGLTYHRPDSACMQMLRNVYELYGKAGKDNLWVASWDEIYEYVTLREGTQITSEMNGNELDFYISLPSRTDFQFEELSLLLDGAPGVTVEAVSDNIAGLTHAQRGNSELINLRFGSRWERLAEKYTAEYEAAASKESLDDARYFVSHLLPRLAEPFERRLSAIEPPAEGQVTFEGAKRYQKQYGGYSFELNRTLSPKK